MNYMNRDDRRSSIVAAAGEIILREGLAAATVRRVAQALGASPGQIHHHFVSADELRANAFKALWARTAAGFEERLAAMPPRPRVIRALLGDEPAIESLVVRLWNDALIASGQETHVRAAVCEAMEQWLELLVVAIDAGREAGEFTTGTPSIEVARRLAAFCLGTDILASVGVPGHSRGEIHSRAGRCVDLELSRGEPRVGRADHSLET